MYIKALSPSQSKLKYYLKTKALYANTTILPDLDLSANLYAIVKVLSVTKSYENWYMDLKAVKTFSSSVLPLM